MLDIDQLERLARKHGYVLVPMPKLRRLRWQQCAEFLRSMLARGSQPAKSVYRHAMKAGFSASLVRQTKKKIGILSRYYGRPGKHGYWMWELPEDDTEKR